MKKICIILLFLCLFLIIPITKADLFSAESIEQEGSWNTVYPNSFNSTGDNIGHWGALYDNNEGSAVENFSAYHMRINVTDFGATLRFLSFSDFKEVKIILTLNSGLFGATYNLNFTMTEDISWFGATKDTKMNFGGTTNVLFTEMIDVYIIRDMATNNTFDTRIGMWFDSGGTTTLPNGTILNGYYVFFNHTYTIVENGLFEDNTFFNNPILIGWYIEHRGSGHFRIENPELQHYSNGETPEIIGGIDLQKVVETYTIWVEDALNFIIGGVTFFIDLLNGIGTALINVAPYLPLILICYLIDAGLTSIKEGSFVPIGNAFMKLYELLLLAWDRLISLGMLIWDAITFWT